MGKRNLPHLKKTKFRKIPLFLKGGFPKRTLTKKTGNYMLHFAFPSKTRKSKLSNSNFGIGTTGDSGSN